MAPAESYTLGICRCSRLSGAVHARTVDEPMYLPKRTLLLAVSETSLIISGLVLATFVSMGSDAAVMLHYEHGGFKIAVAALTCMLCMYYYDLYDSLLLLHPRRSLTRLVQVLGTSCVILAVLYYAYPSLRLNRSVVLTSVVLIAVLLSCWRGLFSLLNRSARLADRVVVLGNSALAVELAREMERRSELGLRLVGCVESGLQPLPAALVASGGGRVLQQAPVVAAGGARALAVVQACTAVPERPRELTNLGGWEELKRLVEAREIDRLVVTMNDRRGALPVEALLELKSRGVLIQDGAELYERITGRVPLAAIRPSWLLFSSGFRLTQFTLFCKRALSILLSLLGLLVASPLMLLVALAIRLDSKGPVIFRQKRVGKDGKIFILYKFRSMKVNADGDGKSRPAQKNDDRCTRVGRFLRRSRLDELPQLFNILRGDMYFVGPRPFVPDQEEELVQKIPFYRHRWAVRPGATGWAQIHRGYCATLEDNREKLAYDLFYIKNCSLGMDLLIMFQTFKTLILRRGGQ